MSARAGKIGQPKRRAADRDSRPRERSGQTPFEDNRPEALRQGAIQAMADRHVSGRRWALQREIDTSSSPFLPDYEEGEQPAWKDEGGVPEWAKEAYEAEAPEVLIASVKGGKIGSVYIGAGRIRTTHKSGPEKGDHAVTVRFNIVQADARAAFEAANPDIYDVISAAVAKTHDPKGDPKGHKKAAKKQYRRARDGWIARTLDGAAVDALPAWAQKVEGPDTAFDPASGEPPAGVKLFEVFKSINGKVEGWHPSRGIAAKFETTKQTISVLEAGIAHIAKFKDAKKRNAAFYDFIAHRLPDLAKLIRKPDEV